MKDKLKYSWELWQKLLDLHGDTYVGAFTLLILVRIGLVLRGYAPVTMSEATAYSTCVAAFAYSNKGDK